LHRIYVLAFTFPRFLTIAIAAKQTANAITIGRIIHKENSDCKALGEGEGTKVAFTVGVAIRVGTGVGERVGVAVGLVDVGVAIAVGVGAVVWLEIEVGVGVGEGVELTSKLAVIVPGPFTSTVVESELELKKLIEPMLVVHLENE